MNNKPKRKSKPSQTKTMTEQIIPEIGRGMVRNQFKDYRFIESVMELVMNAWDWGATELIIQSSKDSITFTDNGIGMDENNRHAFCCLNLSTACSEGKLGRFDTGTKKLLFSHGCVVEVWTVPQNDPDHVYYFSLSSDDYEDQIWDKKPVSVKCMAKKDKTWTSPFNQGSIIRYSRFQHTRDISTGEILRDAISARVASSRYAQIWVDGQTLEKREILAKPFLLTEQDPRLGKITLELYRPAKRRQKDQVSVGALDIGICRLTDFMDLLSSKDADRIPSVYRFHQVCGLILFEALSEFRAESSKSFDPRLNESGLVELILQFLCRHENRVRETLGLTQEQQNTEAFDSAARVVIEACDRAFNPEGTIPPGDNGYKPSDPTSPTEDAEDLPQPKHYPAISLRLPRHEFSLGEKFQVDCLTVKKYVSEHEKIRWHFDKKSVADCEISSDTRSVVITLGRNLGTFNISASVVDKPDLIATERYRVVAKRRMHLHSNEFHQKAGLPLLLTIHNSDLTSGNIAWEATGGQLENTTGLRNTYQCGFTPGTYRVKVWDKQNPSLSDEATIIIEHGQKLIKIRDHWFRLQTFNLKAANSGDEGMVFFREGTKVHDICVDCGHITYQFASQHAALTALLLKEIAFGYPRFVWLRLQDHGQDVFSTHAMTDLMHSWENQGSVIMEELSQQLSSGNKS